MVWELPFLLAEEGFLVVVVVVKTPRTEHFLVRSSAPPRPNALRFQLHKENRTWWGRFRAARDHYCMVSPSGMEFISSLYKLY